MKPTILTPEMAKAWSDDDNCYVPKAVDWNQFASAMNDLELGHTEVITREQAELTREAWALIEAVGEHNSLYCKRARALIARRNGEVK